MSSFQKPLYISDVFNTSLYDFDESNGLTIYEGDRRYLKLSGGIVNGLTTFNNSLNVNGSLSINGSAIDLSLISGVVAGTPQNSKALSLDSSGKINGGLSMTGTLSSNKVIATLTASDLSWQSIAGTTTIALNHTLNGTALLGSTTNSAFGFSTNDTERMRILSGGNVGIGTATAGYKLDVNGDINSNNILRVNRTTSGQSFNSTNGTSSCVLYHFNNADAYFGTSTVNNLILQTNNVSRMIIGSAGGITGISSLTGTTLIASTTLTVNGVDVGSNIAPLVGITLGTPANSKVLTLDSSGNINGGFNISSLVIGTGFTGPNLLRFYGTTGDANNNMTVIGERIYSGTECSELVLFKGNDPAGPAGPDRIRLRASEHRFQTYTATEDWSTLADNNDRFVILNNGNCGIGVSNPAYQLEVSAGGTGLNIPALKFSGTTFNHNYYVSITEGGAVAQKAVVLNVDKDYSGMRDLSITRSFIASTSIASPSITCNTITGDNGAGSSILNLAYTTLNLNAVAMTSTADQLNYCNVSQGISTASKALVMNASNKIGSIGELGFSALSLNYKTVMRASTIASSAGIEFYDTQFQTPTNQPIINFKTGNNDKPIFFRMCGYLNDNATMVANGQPFDISYLGDLSYTAGLRISAINTTQASGSNYNIVLAARNATIPHLVVNDQKNQLHLFPQGTAEINTSYVQNVIVGSDLFVRKTLQVGTSQDTARLISALDSTQGVGTSKYFCLGRDNTNLNQAEISFYYAGSSSNQNRLDFGFYGGALMFLRGDGRLGIGTSSPRAALEVVGTSTYTIIPFATNTYIYNVSNNTWNNLGGGPVSITICAFFNDDIYVQNSVYTSSDRRLKDNIKELDIDIERYKLLKPSSYNYKNQADKTKIGLIAQDVMKVCGEAITYTENENMKTEEIDDPEGVQLGMDYNAISVLNVAIIKKLIERIESLESMVNKLIERPVVSRWLNKKTQQ